MVLFVDARTLGWNQKRQLTVEKSYTKKESVRIDQLKYPFDGKLNSKKAMNVHGLAYGYACGNSKRENSMVVMKKCKIRVLTVYAFSRSLCKALMVQTFTLCFGSLNSSQQPLCLSTKTAFHEMIPNHLNRC